MAAEPQNGCSIKEEGVLKMLADEEKWSHVEDKITHLVSPHT